MIVEFVGLPGAGKTTVARRLATEDGFHVVSIRHRRELLWYNMQLVLRHPIRYMLLLVYILKEARGWWMFRYKIMSVFLQYNAKYMKAQAYERAIIDQGHVHGALSVFEKTVSIAALRQYLQLAFVADTVIIFELPSDASRLRTTDRIYITQLHAGVAAMEHKRIIMSENVAALTRNTNFFAHEMRVDATQRPDDVYRTVRTFLLGAT